MPGKVGQMDVAFILETRASISVVSEEYLSPAERDKGFTKVDVNGESVVSLIRRKLNAP